MTTTEASHIQLHRISARIQVLAGERMIADSRRALQLEERGYPPRMYIPREDVDETLLIESDKHTHCPFKGDTCYYHVDTGEEQFADAAWSYPEPIESMLDIAAHLSFDHPQLTLHFEDS